MGEAGGQGGGSCPMQFSLKPSHRDPLDTPQPSAPSTSSSGDQVGGGTEEVTAADNGRSLRPTEMAGPKTHILKVAQVGKGVCFSARSQSPPSFRTA